MTLIEINHNGLWRQRRFEFCNALEAALDDTLSVDSRSAAWEALAMYGVVAAPSDAGWKLIDTAPKIENELLLIRFEHINYALAAPEDKHRWEEVCAAYWTNFNSGGWVWHGIAGKATHWRSMPKFHAEEDDNGEARSSIIGGGK